MDMSIWESERNRERERERERDLQFLCREPSQTSCLSIPVSSSPWPSLGSVPLQPQPQSPPVCRYTAFSHVLIVFAMGKLVFSIQFKLEFCASKSLCWTYFPRCFANPNSSMLNNEVSPCGLMSVPTILLIWKSTAHTCLIVVNLKHLDAISKILKCMRDMCMSLLFFKLHISV